MRDLTIRSDAEEFLDPMQYSGVGRKIHSEAHTGQESLDNDAKVISTESDLRRGFLGRDFFLIGTPKANISARNDVPSRTSQSSFSVSWGREAPATPVTATFCHVAILFSLVLNYLRRGAQAFSEIVCRRSADPVPILMKGSGATRKQSAAISPLGVLRFCCRYGSRWGSNTLGRRLPK